MTANNLIIKNYENYMKKNLRNNDRTVKHEVVVIKKLKESLNRKSFKNATEEDILNYLSKYAEVTRDSRLIKLKKFYRWLYDLENGERLPDCIRRIKIKLQPIKRYEKNEVKYRERIISEKEFQKLLDQSTKLVYKAILETLYYFGVRVSELESMNATDISFDGQITKITVRESKYKARDVIYKGRPENLLKYFENYQPFKKRKDKPLFVTAEMTRYTKSGIEQFIRRLSENILGKRYTPHDFRHTAVTNARKQGIPISFLEKNFGYQHGSAMMKIYDHNQIQDYENYLKEKSNDIKPTYEQYENSIDELKKEIDVLKEKLEFHSPTIVITLSKEEENELKKSGKSEKEIEQIMKDRFDKIRMEQISKHLKKKHKKEIHNANRS